MANVFKTHIVSFVVQKSQSLKRKKNSLEDQIRLTVDNRNAKICKTEELRDQGEAILSTVVELADWITTLKVCYTFLQHDLGFIFILSL